MNEIVSGMTEKSKIQQAAAFNLTKAENLKKMQEITQLIKSTNRKDDFDEEPEETQDDFENYMEQSLMAEAEQMVETNDIYSNALKKVEQEISK